MIREAMRAALAEQTWVDYKPAGFGSRSLAYMLDMLIRWGTIGLLLLLVILIPGLGGVLRGFGQALEWVENTVSLSPKAFGQLLMALAGIAIFTIEWGYPIFFELKFDGVTPGKRLMGLRVVNQDGLPITWRASLLRNILSTVDLMPGIGCFALVSMMVTKHHQRLGDLVAGTIVIHEEETVDLSKLDQTENTDSTLLLPLETYNVLGSLLQRLKTITPDFKRDAIAKLVRALEPHTKVFARSDFTGDSEHWLAEIHRRAKPIRRKFTEGETDRTVDLKPIRAELVKTKQLFDTLVSKGNAPTKQSLYDTALGYQRLCQLYAYLSTFYPQTAEANYSAGMVRLGRRLIYSRRLERSRAEERSGYFTRVTDGLSASSGHIVFASACAIVAALITAALIQLNPELAWYFLNEELADELRQGHIWTEKIKGMESLAASKIMTNNIAVSFTAFAAGIFGGFGSLVLMIFNGAHLGGMFSALTHYGMAHRLAQFILAHGFLELSIIGVAGGCGLYVGDALISPGHESRGTALTRRAKVVLELLIFSAVCLIPCGIIEGHVSPSESIPVLVKLLVGMTAGYLYWSVVVSGAPIGWNPLKTVDRLVQRGMAFLVDPER